MLAKVNPSQWPVHNDHCFQRIVLDTICCGVWYDYIARPAYKNMTFEQAQRAVQICELIVIGRADLPELNQMSLTWRGKTVGSKIRTHQSKA
jgi:hypothetical protein